MAATKDFEIKDISVKMLREILSDNGIEHVSDIDNISSNLKRKIVENKKISEISNKKIEDLRIKITEKDEQLKEKDEQLKEKDEKIDYLMNQGRDWVNRCYELEKYIQMLNFSNTKLLLEKEENVSNKKIRLLD